MKTKSRAFMMMAILFTFALLVNACGSKTATNTPAASSGTSAATAAPSASAAPAKTEAPKNLPTINVAYHPNLQGAGAVVVAEEKGYFKEAGIKVNLVKFIAGPPEFQAMVAGDIDIGFIGPGAAFLAAQGKGTIIAIDCLNFGDMVLTRKETNIKEFKDLKGKTVGVPKGTSGETMLNLGLEKAGLKPTDLNILNMDAAGAVSAFVSGKIDAVGIWSPFSFEIEKQLGKDKIVKLGDNNMFYPEITFPSTFVASPKFLKEKKDLVEKFLQAYTKASDYRMTHIDETVKLVAAFTQIPEDSVRVQNETTKWISSKDELAFIKDGSIYTWFENLQKTFVKSGTLTAVVDPKTFINSEPYTNVVK